MAVYSTDERIDPVGACVGIKGVRVQSIVRELNNERIDIIPYSANPELFVTRALAPAKVIEIDIFEDEEAITVAVEDEKLSLAIGKAGQNARLASKLTGWKINIMSGTEYNEMKKREAEEMVQIGDMEGVGAKLKEKLVTFDYSTVQQLAKAEVEDLTKIEGIGPKKAETLITRARDFVEEIAANRRKEELERQEAEDLEKIDSEDEIKDEEVDAEDTDDSNEDVAEKEAAEDKTSE